MSHKYELTVAWSREDAAFVVDVPELPGCMAHGATPAEAVANRDGSRPGEANPAAARTWAGPVHLRPLITGWYSPAGRPEAADLVVVRRQI